LVLKPKRLSELTAEERRRLMQRATLDIEAVRREVEEIIRDVRSRGDEAILSWYEKFYGKPILKRGELRVQEREFDEAYSKVSEEFLEAVRRAKRNIAKFHRAQLPPKIWMVEVEPGVWAGRTWQPLQRIGVYVPGGRASYPSTALMTVVPGRVVGVEKIIACTPPRKDGKVDPHTLVALKEAGADEVFKVGGAHAVAAMAYGTETIPKVDKIIGPGGIYTTAAKMLLCGVVATDLPAGPSEVLILADETADPTFVALDLLSQAEHDPSASAILITTSQELAEEVAEEVKIELEQSERREIIEESLSRYGAIIVCNDLQEALEFINEYAPEHLEIQTRNPTEILPKIRHAGSIFIGEYTPVPAGDYAIGTNHVLPTGGKAKSYSPLSTEHYITKIDIQILTEEGLKNLEKTIQTLSKSEKLPLHGKAVAKRLEGKR